MKWLMVGIWIASLLGPGCRSDGDKEVTEDSGIQEVIEFHSPKRVSMRGYTGEIMEPFLSRDGKVLFFNNLNTPDVNTNLHWSTYVNDTTFEYQGELEGVNTPALEGVPTMDENGVFFYVYTGAYAQTFSSISQGIFSNGTLIDTGLVLHISRNRIGWVNFDVEVSANGQTLYFVDGTFDANGGPYEANFVIARKVGGQFRRTDDYAEIMRNINTDALEYAAAVTPDELDICFTRVIPGKVPSLYVATRENISDPFTNIQLVGEADGFVEAGTYTPDGKGLYYHKKKADGKHGLYWIRKK
ncbi:MAG: hypothetical protein AAGI38_20400 [Bacteroidota bacterium]